MILVLTETIFGKAPAAQIQYLLDQHIFHRGELMKYFIALLLAVSFFMELNSFGFCNEQNNFQWAGLVISSIEHSRPFKIDAAGLKQSLVAIDFSQDGVDAAIEMWKRNEKDYLELVWWRQYDRTIRTVILSLFYTQSKMTTSDAPLFDSYLRKISEEERNQRGDEMDYVLKNEGHLKSLLTEALKRK